MAGCFCRLQGISDDCIKEASPHPSGWAMPLLVKADIRNPLHYLQDHKESRLVRNPPVNGSLLTRFRKWVLPYDIS